MTLPPIRPAGSCLQGGRILQAPPCRIPRAVSCVASRCCRLSAASPGSAATSGSVPERAFQARGTRFRRSTPEVSWRTLSESGSMSRTRREAGPGRRVGPSCRAGRRRSALFTRFGGLRPKGLGGPAQPVSAVLRLFIWNGRTCFEARLESRHGRCAKTPD